MTRKETYEDNKSRWKSIFDWFDIRNRSIGSIAFAINRLTGVGLVVYLYLHLGVLSLLLRGEQGWNLFLSIAKSPLFLTLDMVLIFGILFHGLNGIRVSLVGIGYFTNKQRMLFWILMAIGLLVFAISGVLIFGVI